MRLKMKKGTEVVEFFVYKDGTARVIGKGKSEVVKDFADEYIRLREDGFKDIYI